jgi:hypothetical protein
MKINLTFKTPDVAYYATENLDGEKQLEAERAISKWVKNGECLTVEIDTKTKECRALPINESHNII